MEIRLALKEYLFLTFFLCVFGVRASLQEVLTKR